MIKLITRADDLGSSISANKGIKTVCDAGFFKNVSVMAPGPYVEHAAKLLAGRNDICFGLHMTLNAEWDKVKWKPLTKLDLDSGLVDEDGFFLNSPQLFINTKPSLDVIMKEITAQYDYLIELGFDIKYIDSHMMSEFCIPGMDEAVKEFAIEKGLVDHMYFYTNLPDFQEACETPSTLPDFLKSLTEEQYIVVMHPALYGDDMLLTGTSETSGEEIARGRSEEVKIFSDPALIKILNDNDSTFIRYDEAKPLVRMIV